jgi:hypothetical protein
MAPVEHDGPVSLPVRQKNESSVSIDEVKGPANDGSVYGKEMLKNFLFEPSFHNLNHGENLHSLHREYAGA